MPPRVAPRRFGEEHNNPKARADVPTDDNDPRQDAQPLPADGADLSDAARGAEAGRVLARARRDQQRQQERVAANLTSLAETIGELARGVSEGGNAEDDHAILGQAFAHTLGLLAQLARAQGAVEFLKLDASS